MNKSKKVEKPCDVETSCTLLCSWFVSIAYRFARHSLRLVQLGTIFPLICSGDDTIFISNLLWVKQELWFFFFWRSLSVGFLNYFHTCGGIEEYKRALD